MDWLDLLACQGTLKSLLQHHSSKASILWCSAFFMIQLLHPYMTTGKTIALTRWIFVGRQWHRGKRQQRRMWGFAGGTSGKEFTCQCRRPRRRELDHWIRKIPWRRKWQPTPVFLPGESHGQRSLWATVLGVTESDTTEHKHTHIHTQKDVGT